MNNMTIAGRFDYGSLLAFLNEKYGDLIEIRCATFKDTTMVFTHLDHHICAIAINIQRFNHTLYMIDPDTYGIVADYESRKEYEKECAEVNEVEPVPTGEPSVQCARFGCEKSVVGYYNDFPYCCSHLHQVTAELSPGTPCSWVYTDDRSKCNWSAEEQLYGGSYCRAHADMVKNNR